jgi:hypothetical protein
MQFVNDFNYFSHVTGNDGMIQQYIQLQAGFWLPGVEDSFSSLLCPTESKSAHQHSTNFTTGLQ